MKVFISSLITGFGPTRDAAAGGIAALGHQPIRAEEFGASPESPQQACLAGVRAADVLVLVLGAGYGHPQASGLAATHEEYLEARDSTPVLVFIQDGVDAEPKQADFIREVQGWEQGHFTETFVGPDDLRDKVTRGLHGFELANETAPLDEQELERRSEALVSALAPQGRPALLMAVAGGPARAVLRPAELEGSGLVSYLTAEALTGPDAVLTPALGTRTSLHGDTVRLVQPEGVGFVSVSETGDVVSVQPATDDDRLHSHISALIEEEIRERLTRAIRFAAHVLDHVDQPQRLTHVAIHAGIRGAGYMPWRTREEQRRSPNAASMGLSGSDNVTAGLSPAVHRRPALVHETQRLAEDLTVRLRRGLGER